VFRSISGEDFANTLKRLLSPGQAVTHVIFSAGIFTIIIPLPNLKDGFNKSADRVQAPWPVDWNRGSRQLFDRAQLPTDGQ